MGSIEKNIADAIAEEKVTDTISEKNIADAIAEEKITISEKLKTYKTKLEEMDQEDLEALLKKHDEWFKSDEYEARGIMEYRDMVVTKHQIIEWIMSSDPMGYLEGGLFDFLVHTLLFNV